jgi:hypothetical protein
VSDSSQGGTPPHNPYGGQGGSGENPYGQPPGQPYGQPGPGEQPPSPYGQPPASNPYAQPAPTQEPYGQHTSPYGVHQQPPAGPLGDGLDMYGRPLGRRVSDDRPGTVTTAGWITLVLSGLSFLLYAFITVAMLVAKDDITTEIDKAIVDSGQSSSTFNAEDAYGLVVGVMVVLTLWCLIACVLAVFTMRRGKVARILLVISCVVTAMFSLLGIKSVVSIVPLVASIAVIVLLFTGSANAWFRDRY